MKYGFKVPAQKNETIKIVINALSARRGGGQTYIQHLLEKCPEDTKFNIYLLAPDTLIFPEVRSNIHRLDIAGYLINYPVLRTVWEIFVLPKVISNIGADILFCPGGSVSGRFPKSCKIVTTFQNMLPFDITQRRKYPFGYMRLRNWILNKKLLNSMLKSDLVIFISNYAKLEIEKQVNNNINNSIVIPHGVNPAFRRHSDKNLPCPSWLPTEGYLLYVSIFDVYKAQVEVIEAYALLRHSDSVHHKLVLVGPEYAPYGVKVRDTIARLNLQNSVIIKSAIPNCDLPAVYQNATVNIFASETENCPFILLEALAAGRPLLVSNRPPMPEFGGDAVVYFDPKTPTELKEKLSSVLGSQTLMAELSEKALERSYKYDWADTARNTWDALLKLTSRQINSDIRYS